MLGERETMADELFVACSLRDLIPDDYILKKVDRGVGRGGRRGDPAGLFAVAQLSGRIADQLQRFGVGRGLAGAAFSVSDGAVQRVLPGCAAADRALAVDAGALDVFPPQCAGIRVRAFAGDLRGGVAGWLGDPAGRAATQAGDV